jgi:predicted dehydrogenase
MVIEAIGRRIRLAVIGGGPGSVIGEIHRIAARLDGYYEIVASVLSSDPERSRRTGVALGVAENRAYVPPGWRLDPARIGGSMILIDIGTHAHHLAGYVSGLDLEIRHEPADRIDRNFPTVEDGVKGLAFVEAAIQSSAFQSWQSVKMTHLMT